MKYLALISSFVITSLEIDSRIGFNPETDFVESVTHLLSKPEIFTKEKLDKFKKQHSTSKFLDITDSVFFDNHDVRKVFSEGSKFIFKTILFILNLRQKCFCF